MKLSEITEELKSPGVFVCVASFEDRCRAVAETLRADSTGEVIIFENADYAEHVESNAEAIKNRFGGKARRITIRTDDPLVVADRLRDELVPTIRRTSELCLVDVTTFTHEQLLILVRLLMDLTPSANIQFIYNQAAAYSTNTTADEFWLSKGVYKVRAILGFPGEMLPSMKTHLMVLAGYEYERAEKLITELEPSLISLGLGKRDEGNSEHYTRNKIMNERIEKFIEGLSASISKVLTFEFSSVDPVEAKEDILRQCHSYAGYNVVVAPMNTKLSTIGAGLAAIRFPRIQLVYALPIAYNMEGYSSPSDNCTLFDFSTYLKNPQSLAK